MTSRSGAIPASPAPRRALSLAAPIVYKGRLAGVIYLENDLTRSAFTPDRVELIRLLAAQAAISIENARLYADLQWENAEQRRAEAFLRENQALLQSIVDNTTAVIFAKDLDGRYMLVNRGFRRALPHEPRGGHRQDRPRPLPARAGRWISRQRSARPAAEPGRRARRSGPQSDGVRTYMSLKFPLRDPAGKPRGICGISTDITSRKHAEDVLRHSYSLLEATLESTADGILVVDGAKRFVRNNDEFARMWRMPEDILATGSDDVFLAFVRDQLCEPELFVQTVHAAYAEPEASAVHTLSLLDGRVFEHYSQPQRLGGRVVGRVWSFRDVTARVSAEEERDRLLCDERRARAQAEEAVRLRDEFLSIASHELNTPLTCLQLAVQSLGQSVSRGMDVQRVQSAAAFSERQVKRLTDLVDRLLDVSASRRGGSS